MSVSYGGREKSSNFMDEIVVLAFVSSSRQWIKMKTGLTFEFRNVFTVNFCLQL